MMITFLASGTTVYKMLHKTLLIFVTFFAWCYASALYAVYTSQIHQNSLKYCHVTNAT